MHPAALRSLLAKAGWTAAQAGVAVLPADAIVSALGVPKAYDVVATAVLGYGLSAVKNFVASKCGDPTTTRFDGPLRSKKYPLKHLPVDQLDQVALATYQGVDGVSAVEGASGDPVAPHGVNQPGETD